jgi:signal transduction histidine kinase
VVYVCLDLAMALVALVPLTIGLSLATGLAVTVIGGAAALAAMFIMMRPLDRLERSRTRALLGVDITPPPAPSGAHRFWFIGRELSHRPGWRSFVYWCLKQIEAPIGFSLVTGAWASGLVLASLPLTIRTFPDDTAHFGLFDVSNGTQLLLTFLAGIVVLSVVAPAVTLACARISAGMARNLLGGSRVAELEERLGVTTARRDAAVDAAEAERRRIERDLHDGAQQRLVALAMSLGMAKEKFDTEPAAARALLDEAHGEAKAAMTELRNIARGIHPAVLSDRGLDAALSGLVARTSVPVALTVSLVTPGGGGRLPEAIEGAAYYVVAEALTNVTKHSEATRAAVQLVRQGDRLVIDVTDDGTGGAVIRTGGGLAGLRDRVTSLGGFLHVSSPTGGPTSLLVELPCGS